MVSWTVSDNGHTAGPGAAVRGMPDSARQFTWLVDQAVAEALVVVSVCMRLASSWDSSAFCSATSLS